MLPRAERCSPHTTACLLAAGCHAELSLKLFMMRSSAVLLLVTMLGVQAAGAGAERQGGSGAHPPGTKPAS